MRELNPVLLKKLYVPSPSSHKGQNGKLLTIGGSKLFHAASLWSLKVASRIVDMVFYSSVPENNEIVKVAKEEFRDGIVVSRNKIEDYINEADCVLIGPGLPRKEGQEVGDDDTKELTERLLRKYAHKKWVIDGGSLQTISPSLIPPNAILTPHHREFEMLFKLKSQKSKLNPFDKLRVDAERSRSIKTTTQKSKIDEETVQEKSKEYKCVILLKGERDIVCAPFDSAQGETRCVRVSGGNAGMTKGGTGDVLAGLVAALYCKNDAFLSASAGSYINKKAGEELYKRVGNYFNASDLADEIPKMMKKLLSL